MLDISYNINKLMKFIQKCRIEEGYSQESVAKYLEVTRLTYINWENSVTEPKISHLFKICSLFGLSLNELVNFKCSPSNSISELNASGCYEIIVNTIMRLLVNTTGNIHIGKAWYENFLYILESDYYFTYHKPIFDLSYVKTVHGAHIYNFAPLINSLCKKGYIQQLESPRYTNERKKYIPLKEHNYSAFLPEQKDFLDSYINKLTTPRSGFGLKQLQQLIRTELPYRMSDILAKINYKEFVSFKHEPIITI